MGILNPEIAYGLAATSFLVYLIGLGVYRLYLCPVAKFPGPRFAALTFWYEFYYDVIRRGQYEFEIAKMHNIYGPIVRINSMELHINDLDYIDILYSTSSGKVDKWPWVMKMFGNQDSTFGSAPHDLHRRRRAAISPFFSKRAVGEFEPTIRYYIGLLLWGTAGFPRLNGFYARLAPIFVKYSASGHLIKHFGWVAPLMQSLPDRVSEALDPTLNHVPKLFQSISRQLNMVLQERNNPTKDMKTPPHRTIFHEVFDSNLPSSEKQVSRLTHEGALLMGAGTTTTADVLGAVTFHLLKNPDMMQRLQAELKSSLSSSKEEQTDTIAAYPKLQELEQLPYLSAIIKEGLRVFPGVAHRLSRIFPDTDLKYKDWIIPRGTPVGMSSWAIHANESKFPEPRKFKPERWLEGQKSAADDERLEKYLFSFGKGTRQCVGLNLAYAEIYLGLAAMFTPGNNLQFELFETDVSDVEMVRDSFVPQVKDDTKGIRVIVR